MTVEDVRRLLRRRCDEAGGIGRWARAQDPVISDVHVGDVLRGRKAPGDRLCALLGVERTVSVAYRMIGETRQARGRRG